MLRWIGRESPLVVVFISMAAGILACVRDVEGLVFACVMLVLTVQGRRGVIQVAIGFFSGLVAFWLAPCWAGVPNGDHLVSGEVVSLEFEHGRCRAALGHVRVDGESLRGRVLVTLDEVPSDLGCGARVECTVKVRDPRGMGNQGEFDYKRHLLGKNVVMSGYVPRGAPVTVRKSGRTHGIRKEMIDRMNMFARPEAELLKAMVLGDRSGVTVTMQDSFNSMGLAHLLAISGLHIGIVFAAATIVAYVVLSCAGVFIERIDTPSIARVAGMVSAGWYTVFVGAGVTVLRACIMVVTVTAALYFLKRKNSILEALAAAGVLILSVWPLALFGASFLLSFSAVLGIAAVLEKTKGCPAWFASSLVTPAAGVFTLPVVVYLFGFVPAGGVLANLIVVPFFGMVIMPLSFVGLLADSFHLAVGPAAIGMAMDAVGFVMRSSEILGSLHPVTRPWPSWSYACVAGLSIAFLGRPSRSRTIALAVLVAAVVMLPLVRRGLINAEPLTFDFISVGQGDSILVTAKGCAVLIDAGQATEGFDAGRSIVAPHLLARGVTRLDVLVVTHSHPDHAGGVPFILERFDVGQVWTNTCAEGNIYYEEVTMVTQRKSIPLRFVRRGDTYRVGPVEIRVLNPLDDPAAPGRRVDQNMQSVVLMIGDACMRGLFMADADLTGELVQVHLGQDIRAHVLKAAHHGGRRSCLDPFLDAVKPEIVVISGKGGTGFGGPSEEALGRLSRHGARVFRTDLHGGVVVRWGALGPAVKSAWNPADTHLRCNRSLNCTQRRHGAQRPRAMPD